MKCKDIEENCLSESIKNLPEIQQLALKSCFKAAKCSSKNGRRYTVNYIYECILMRIKSRCTYEHIRKRDILPLPTINTLNSYIKGIKPIYGFDEQVFAALKQKQANMTADQRRGKIVNIFF